MQTTHTSTLEGAELAGLLNTARQGDTLARRQVAEAFLPLVSKICSGRLEAISECTVTLLRAIETFDPAIRDDFAAYAKMRISFAFRDWKRGRDVFRRVGEDGKRHLVHAPEHLSLDQENDHGTLHERVPSAIEDSETTVSRYDMARKIVAALDVLTPLERRVVSERTLSPDECTLDDIAKRCGISRQAVHCTEKRAHAKLRKAVG